MARGKDLVQGLALAGVALVLLGLAGRRPLLAMGPHKVWDVHLDLEAELVPGPPDAGDQVRVQARAAVEYSGPGREALALFVGRPGARPQQVGATPLRASPRPTSFQVQGEAVLPLSERYVVQVFLGGTRIAEKAFRVV